MANKSFLVILLLSNIGIRFKYLTVILIYVDSCKYNFFSICLQLELHFLEMNLFYVMVLGFDVNKGK